MLIVICHSSPRKLIKKVNPYSLEIWQEGRYQRGKRTFVQICLHSVLSPLVYNPPKYFLTVTCSCGRWPFLTSGSAPVVTDEKPPRKLMKMEKELSEQAEYVCLKNRGKKLGGMCKGCFQVFTQFRLCQAEEQAGMLLTP